MMLQILNLRIYTQSCFGVYLAIEEVTNSLRYFYIVLDDKKTAWCFTNLKFAKSQAKEHKSLIYFSKKRLPAEVEKIKGACNESVKTPTGQFTTSLDANKFDKGE